MNHAAGLNGRAENIAEKSTVDVEPAPSRLNVLVATIDPAIRSGLTDLFRSFPFNTIWLEGVEAAKTILAREKIAACLCGFWLQDGAYRELVRHIRRERMEIPVIIVSAPACPDEYSQYLAATHIGALDFLSYPYRKSDLERMLWLATEPQTRSMRQEVPAIGLDISAGEAA